jgi:hypothetical protein
MRLRRAGSSRSSDNNYMTVSEPQALEGTARAKRARAAGLPQRLKRCVAMWCDAQRRVAELAMRRGASRCLP